MSGVLESDWKEGKGEEEVREEVHGAVSSSPGSVMGIPDSEHIKLLIVNT